MRFQFLLFPALFLIISLPLYSNNDRQKKEQKKVLVQKNYKLHGKVNSTAYSRFLYEPVSTKRDKTIHNNRKRYEVSSVPQYRIKVKTQRSTSYRDRNHKLNRQRKAGQ